jgi:hypothetical protein
MMNNTNDNFWLALQQQQPLEIRTPLYRLYHNELGDPLFYSMDDLPGNYVDVDPDVFRAGPVNVRVVDGKLNIIKTTTIHKLRPHIEGTACHPQDVAVVVAESEPHVKWSLK